MEACRSKGLKSAIRKSNRDIPIPILVKDFKERGDEGEEREPDLSDIRVLYNVHKM